MVDRRVLFLDGSLVTVPVNAGAQEAMDRVMRTHTAEIDAALAPFGLASFGLASTDILIPTYERVVWADEASPTSP